ncbi:MAG: SprT family zinc-dependent metalloprotease [Gudongella sp.]|nr:SprT family zinc-dependent metalloprotease [Gudongella sp.]
MKLSYEYGTQTIEFEVIFRKRKTMAIQIQPPDIVTVISPKGVKEDEILKAVKTKSKWITQKLFQIREMEYLKRNREYVNGESFVYMGRNYSLQIIIDESYKVPEAKLFRGKFYVYTHSTDADTIRRALEKWYKKKALQKVLERIDYYQKYFDVSPNKVMIKEQKKRWGSCSSHRNLYFNWKCIMAPSPVLDYLVVHEMSHMVHMNHSPEFWNLVRSIIPDYEERRKLLKNQGVKYDL